MAIDKNTLLAMLDRESPTDAVRMAMALLIDPQTVPLDKAPSNETARDALGTWRVRRLTLAQAGKPEYGLESLIANLEKLGGDGC
jgi:hypothetical protein